VLGEGTTARSQTVVKCKCYVITENVVVVRRDGSQNSRYTCGIESFCLLYAN
jgi:hypothetical protein